MGVIIYVSGEIKTDATEAAIGKILQIKDDSGDTAFEEGLGVLTFEYEMYEGSDPVERYVKAPLDRLV